ncbi:hypothetical protein ABC733_01870 [Mangrovibacter sp. SLW1]
MTWNTIDLVNHNGGTPVMSKTGACIYKERMRKEDAIMVEMSATIISVTLLIVMSGMIPWLLVASNY